MFFYTLTYGYSHGFYNGDPAKLLYDMQALKPTSFSTVPVILYKVYDKIMNDVQKKSAF